MHVFKLTNSILAVCHVRRDRDPPLLSDAQTMQSFVNPVDHISHADVCVVGAVSLVADKGSIKREVCNIFTLINQPCRVAV